MFNFANSTLPEDLVNLSSLQRLDVTGIGLSGTIPSSLFRLENLTAMYDLAVANWIAALPAIINGAHHAV